MKPDWDVERDEALRELASEFGIDGEEVYLLDLVPLLEMVWADGAAQNAERSLVYEFALRHAAELANSAAGQEVVGRKTIEGFLSRFLDRAPEAGTLRRLRTLALPLIFDPADDDENRRRRRQILDYCLDIGAAAVRRYPYGQHERFSGPEKDLLLELIEALWPPSRR